MLPYFPFGQQFNDKMGTHPLPESDRLIETDAHYETEIALKRQLLSELPTYYFQALPACELAQWEVLEAILRSLSLFEPDTFSLRIDDDHWHWSNKRLGEACQFIFGDTHTLPLAPLDWVGRQVQEDLIILAGNEASLVAGQLCFGNGWCLAEKLGLPFWEIHAPINPIVPPMMQAARKLMERLPIGRPVWRINWSVKITDQLDMTSRHTPCLDKLLLEQAPGFTPATIGEKLFIRIERQTLTRLPRSGAILFGIHTYQNRLDREIQDRPYAAERLANVFRTTPQAMLDYKGMTLFMPVLLNYLSSVTAASPVAPRQNTLPTT